MARERRFTDTLIDIRDGAVVDDLTNQLRELVTRVGETGRPGSLILTLSPFVALLTCRSGAHHPSGDDIKCKLPIAEKGTTILFATTDGQLQRHDPRQPRLVPLDEGPTLNVHDHAAELEAENATLRRAVQAVPVEADRQRTAAAAARQCTDEGASARAEMHDFCAGVVEGLASRMGQA